MLFAFLVSDQVQTTSRDIPLVNSTAMASAISGSVAAPAVGFAVKESKQTLAAPFVGLRKAKDAGSLSKAQRKAGASVPAAKASAARSRVVCMAADGMFMLVYKDNAEHPNSNPVPPHVSRVSDLTFKHGNLFCVSLASCSWLFHIVVVTAAFSL